MKFIGITNTGYKVYDPTIQRTYTRSDIKFIETDEEERKTEVGLDPEEEDVKQTVDDDNYKEPDTKEKEAHKEENMEGKKKEKLEETKQEEPTRRILPPRNRAPSARYGDYRAYLTEIEELNEENLTYDEALRNGWDSAINDEMNNILDNRTWEPR